MKVCHIIPGYYPRLAAPVHYTRNLADQGIDVDVLAFGRDGDAAEETLSNVRVRRAPLSPKDKFSLDNTLKFVSFCRRKLESEQYDIVHVYGFRGCSLLPMIGRKLARHWIIDVRTRNVTLRPALSFLANLVTRLESLAFDARLTLDEMVGRQVFGNHLKFQVVPLGADFERFSPGKNEDLRKKLGIKSNQMACVFSSGLWAIRKPEYVLKGFGLAQQQYPELKLIMMGDGDMENQLRSIALEMGIEELVLFTGHIEMDDVHNYIAAADISICYIPIIPQFDPQPPLKTIESLASGLPTLATATRGNAIFVENEINGLLIGDSADDLASGILRLVEDTAMRERIASNARNSVKKYDWKTIVRERLLPIYHELLGDGPNSRIRS